MYCKVFAMVRLLVFTSVAFGQSLSVKSGLWESRSVDNDGTVSRSRECMTTDQFKQQLSKLQSGPDCKASFPTLTTRKTVFDVSCQIKSATLKVHAQQDAIDSEHITALITSTMTMNGAPETSTIKGEAHFVSASCGNVKPGAPESIP